MTVTIRLTLVTALLAACGPADSRGNGNGDTVDASNGNGSGNGSGSGSGDSSSYSVYAHSDGVLYTIDLGTKALVTIGNFNAPSSDPITDLAVAPNGTIYVISETQLYTADAQDGHVTKVGSLSTCGMKAVALTTTSDGRIWMGDYNGAICQIDISGATPVVKPPVTMSNGFALAGDMVGVGNGTVFGTVYKLSQSTTQNNNYLAKIDVSTGAVTMLGQSGYPKLFGVAFQQDKVFAFTHDATGRVVTIDPTSGVGTMYATFKDPTTNMPISFAGAGVNSLVVIL